MRKKFLKFAGVVFLLGWVLGQLVRLPGLIPFTLLDLGIFLLISYDSLYNSLAIASRLYKVYGLAMGVLLVSWLLGLRLFSLSEAWPGLLYLIRIGGYGWLILRSRVLLKPVRKYLVPAMGAMLVLGFLQFFLVPDVRLLLQYGWDEHYYRMVGTVLDPNYLGAMLGMIFLFIFIRKLNLDSVFPTRSVHFFYLVIGLLSLTGLVLTWSRASWLATGIAGGWYLIGNGEGKFKINKKKWLAGLIVLMLGVGLLAPKPGGEGVNLLRTGSIRQRIESWQFGIEVWQKNPWLGVGFNNYAVALGKMDETSNHARNAPSNSWLLLLLTVGIAGVVTILFGGIKIFWVTGSVRKISVLGISLAILIGVHALFNNTLFFTPILGLWAIIRADNES